MIKDKISLEAQFEPKTGQYFTTDQQKCTGAKPERPRNLLDNNQRTNDNKKCQGAPVNPANAPQVDQGPAEDKWRASVWPFVMLAGCLLMSIGNTLLLSFVFKSMQTSDEVANFDGKISWDSESLSNLVEMPIQLDEAARLKLNSMEKISQYPLELIVKFEQGDAEDGMQVKFIEQSSSDNSNSSGYFALNLDAAHSNQLLGDQDQLRKTLELGTRMLFLNKINKQQQQHSINRLIDNGRSKSHIDQQTVGRIAELDTLESSVTLPRQTRFHANNDGANINEEVSIQEKLICPHLRGSIEDNLEIQARGRNLICESNEGNLVAESKSGDTKLSFYETISMEAAQIELSARNVYLAKGLKYFERAPTPTSKQEQRPDGVAEDNDDDADASKVGVTSASQAFELVSIGDQLAMADE